MKKNRVSTIAASAILASTLILSGCSDKKSSPENSSAQQDTKTYNLEGVASNVGPISGAIVIAYDANSNEIARVETASDGYYSFENLTTAIDHVVLSGGTDLGLDKQLGGGDDSFITNKYRSHISNSTQDLNILSGTNIADTLENRVFFKYAQKALMLLNTSISKDDAYKLIAQNGFTDNKPDVSKLASASGLSGDNLTMFTTILETLKSQSQDLLDDDKKRLAYGVMSTIMYTFDEMANGTNNSRVRNGLSLSVANVNQITSASSISSIQNYLSNNSNVSYSAYGAGIFRNMGNTTPPVIISSNPPSNSQPATNPAPAVAPGYLTCGNTTPSSGAPKVDCGPKNDEFSFESDFGNLRPNNPNIDGGFLVYDAYSTRGGIWNEIDPSSNRIKNIWITREYVRLNTAAQALSVDQKYNLIESYLDNLFTVNAYTFQNGHNEFELAPNQTRSFLATMAIHFTNNQDANNLDKEFLAVAFQVDVKKVGNRFVYTSPADSKILFTLKELGKNGYFLVDQNQADNIISVDQDMVFAPSDGYSGSVGGNLQFNLATYFKKIIKKAENGNMLLSRGAEVAKRIIVKNVTQEGPIKFHTSLVEIIGESNGKKIFDSDFVRNPGTFEPKDFGLASNGFDVSGTQINPYINAYNHGEIRGITFKVLLK